MATRFARLDVEFLHKRTANKLLDELGPWGPLVFVALILRAKDGSPPGTFSYPNEQIGWERLGLADRDVPFTLDEFLTLTGRLKQSSRTRRGRVTDVKLTRYGHWQKDARRYEEAVKKARIRAHSTGDTTRDKAGDTTGDATGDLGSTSTTNPLPPRRRRRRAPDPQPTRNGLVCPHCGVHPANRAELEDHLELFHPETLATVTADPDDLPL